MSLSVNHVFEFSKVHEKRVHLRSHVPPCMSGDETMLSGYSDNTLQALEKSREGKRQPGIKTKRSIWGFPVGRKATAEVTSIRIPSICPLHSTLSTPSPSPSPFLYLFPPTPITLQLGSHLQFQIRGGRHVPNGSYALCTEPAFHFPQIFLLSHVGTCLLL